MPTFNFRRCACLIALGCVLACSDANPELAAYDASTPRDRDRDRDGDATAPDAGRDAAVPDASDAAAPVVPDDPGTNVGKLSLSEPARAQLMALAQQFDAFAGLDTATLAARHPLSYAAALDYDPTQAQNLDLLQASALALDAPELEKLAQQGFAIAPRHQFPNMAYGYKIIYALDLPVYVSLDAILDAVHLSYGAILKLIEERYLATELQELFTGVRAALAEGRVADAQTASDLDFYFAVGLSLLSDVVAAPVAGASAKEIGEFVALAKAAKDIRPHRLFGSTREYDFSQLSPRGHYTDSEQLERYFRATMWLGRTDLRLIETQPDGSQLFRRRQFNAALALRDVVQARAREAFDHLDAIVGAFVGEHDYMELRDLDALLADLGVAGSAQTVSLSDEQIARVIVDKGHGAQRIASQVIYKEAKLDEAFPLDFSFALLGQRYVVDSHVFSNVVYDRVKPVGDDPRTLPNPLDAAYAAFGNAAALRLLAPELDRHRYAPELERVRTLVDGHGSDYWGENLYNLWLSSLRAISPGTELADPVASGLPAVAATEPWQRRLLNTQLASWAELRHDTILYVKQSYSSGAVCEFPDGYVDPYPDAFERLRLYALKGAEVTALLPAADQVGELGTRVQQYFAELATVTATLRDMAQHERTGMPFNAEQMAFLNDAVKSTAEGCAGPYRYQGWYARLLFDTSDEEMDPTVADVHTDPGGDRPAKVLHVATGLPRLLVVTTNTCEGPRAYAGVAFAYHEIVTGLVRLTDEKWAEMARSAPDVAWMTPILPILP